jgi:transposase
MEVFNIALKCPTMSPDMNPIEHVWDFIGRKNNQRNTKCQNIDELRTDILQECKNGVQHKRCRKVKPVCL